MTPQFISDKKDLEDFAKDNGGKVKVCPNCKDYGVVLGNDIFYHEVDLATYYYTKCCYDNEKHVWNFENAVWDPEDSQIAIIETRECKCNIMIGPCTCGVFEMEKRNI